MRVSNSGVLSYQPKLELMVQGMSSPKTSFRLNALDWFKAWNEIDQLARDGHYETQERLMTRIVEACAKYLEIESIEIGLKNYLSAPKPDH